MSELLDEIEDLSDTNSEEGYNILPQELLAKIQEQWINEKFAPEILPHRNEFLECLFGQIKAMESNLQEDDNRDRSNILRPMYQFEIDRMKYLVSSYLRTRLEKIERYAFFICDPEHQQAELYRSYLTEEELEFAQNYKNSVQQHFDSVLSFWSGVPLDNWKKEFPKPNLDSFVFVKSRKNIDGVAIDEDAIADLKEGSQMIVMYSSIADLLKEGDVFLI